MPRRGHRAKRTVNAISQLEWRDVVNPYGPTEVLGDEQVQTIIDGALHVLETKGMRFLEPGSRTRLASAGADVDEDSMMVRFDRSMVLEQLKHAPSSFELRARNPDRHLQLGTSYLNFASVGGPAFVSDLDKGRRPGTYAEMCDYLRLVQSLNIIHQEGGGPFEAMDLPGETRHLDLYLAQHRLTDKNCQSYAAGWPACERLGRDGLHRIGCRSRGLA
jgi:trimethylamine--corrinoid protein Co-methyltransferase